MGSSEVATRWRRLPGGELEVAQAARAVVEIVLGHIQCRLDAPEVLSPASVVPDGDSGWKTTQAAQPISYVQASERVVGLVGGRFGGEPTHALTDRGRELKLKPRARRGESRTVAGAMDGTPEEAGTHSGGDRDGAGNRGVDGSTPLRRRRPATINIRPGAGGAQRKLAARVDRLAGLEKFEILWWPVPGPGTMLGLIRRDADGNAVAMCRLSGDDRDDTLIDQIDKALALEAANEETLVYRYILLALDMPGTREVRPPRALPPEPGTLERDDIIQLEKWFAEGWVEHAVWRDGRRMARDVLPGEQIVASLKRHRVNLWLSSYGRMIDWHADRLAMRALNLVAAEDRDNIERSLQDARLRKGPLAGKGWRNSMPRFAFIKDPRTLERRQDPEQWPWILRTFELADIGDFEDKGGLSTRKLAKALAEEGCPFDHEQIRKILKDPIYATGEWTVNVRGIPVAQEPIKLENPVPLDRYQRVQAKLALRQGSTKRTPLGEFLFNYVETVHKQCAGETWDSKPVVVRGYVNKGREDERYLRHSPSVPECCKGNGRGSRGAFLWQRRDLEAPVVEKLRELVEHPAVLAQAALAVRHEIATTSTRLSDEQRVELERELEAIVKLEDAAADEWVAKALREAKDDDTEEDLRRRAAEYTKGVESLARKRKGIERRLAADLEARGADAPRPHAIENEENLKRAFLEIMTVETPTDPQLLALRARLFQAIVSGIEIDDDGDPEKPIVITILGHLVPDGAAAAASPLVAGRELLGSYLVKQNGDVPEAERRLAEIERVKEEVGQVAPDAETAYEYGYHKAVSAIHENFFRHTRRGIASAERSQLAAEHWRMRRFPQPVGTPAWATEVAVAADDVYSQLMKEWKCEKPALILAALTRLGEGDAASVAQLLSQHHGGVRDWLKRLAAEGCVKQVRGLGHAKSPAVYAVADREVGTELLRLLAHRLAA